ncbi:MAG: hypothetical protein FJ280_00940 [Planctomycetes bacterium]|nr:hypothetical protein [Planctomycetota bacterium]
MANTTVCTMVINGKKVLHVPDGTTVADARTHLKPVVGNDQFLVEDPTAGTKLLKESDRLKAGQQYWTVPQIVKG